MQPHRWTRRVFDYVHRNCIRTRWSKRLQHLSRRYGFYASPVKEDTERKWAKAVKTQDVLGHGLKLGLGNFVFYSTLLGKASRHGSVASIVACYVSVLVGVLLTVALLVVFRKPMPALPFSIFMGLAAYFTSCVLWDPFLEAIDYNFR
ncbi:hypothetical protein MTO96_052051 [Rhipicephalus appendiculatus]